MMLPSLCVFALGSALDPNAAVLHAVEHLYALGMQARRSCSRRLVL